MVFINMSLCVFVSAGCHITCHCTVKHMLYIHILVRCLHLYTITIDYYSHKSDVHCVASCFCCSAVSCRASQDFHSAVCSPGDHGHGAPQDEATRHVRDPWHHWPWGPETPGAAPRTSRESRWSTMDLRIHRSNSYCYWCCYWGSNVLDESYRSLKIEFGPRENFDLPLDLTLVKMPLMFPLKDPFVK